MLASHLPWERVLGSARRTEYSYGLPWERVLGSARRTKPTCRASIHRAGIATHVLGSSAAAGFFLKNVSEHADGERRARAPIRRQPKDVSHPRRLRCHPPIRSCPSAFAVGMLRKFANTGPSFWLFGCHSDILFFSLTASWRAITI